MRDMGDDEDARDDDGIYVARRNNDAFATIRDSAESG